MTTLEKSGPSPELVAQANDAVVALAKAVRAVHLYDSNNQMRQSFQVDAFNRISSFCAHSGSLVLDVEADGFRFGGSVVHRDEDSKAGIASRLYRDGIRRLQFGSALSQGELSGFLQVLARFAREEGVEDDLVTALWEHDFDNISYVVVETFSDDTSQHESFSQEESAAIDAIVNLIQQDAESTKSVKNMRLSADRAALMSGWSSRIDAPMTDADQRAWAVHIYQVTGSEFQRIQEEIDLLETGDSLEDGLALLNEVLECERDPVVHRLILHAIASLLDSYLGSGEVRPVNKALAGLRILERDARTAAPERTAAILVFFEEYLTPARMKLFLNTLASGQLKAGAGDMFSFFSVQHPKNIPLMISSLPLVASATVRRQVLDAVVLLAGMSCDYFVPHLSSSDPTLIVDMLYALGRIGTEEAAQHVLASTKHPQAQVRVAALAALRKQHSGAIALSMIDSLRDPDAAVRAEGLRHLAHARDRTAVDALRALIGGRQFPDFALDEKKRIFTALGMIGGGAAVPLLREHLFAKSLLNKQLVSELHAAAVAGLGVVNTAEAREVLREGASSSNETVAALCRHTLAQVERTAPQVERP